MVVKSVAFTKLKKSESHVFVVNLGTSDIPVVSSYFSAGQQGRLSLDGHCVQIIGCQLTKVLCRDGGR